MTAIPNHLAKIDVWGNPWHGLVLSDELALSASTLADDGDGEFLPASARDINTACVTQDGVQVIVRDFSLLGFNEIGVRYALSHFVFGSSPRNYGNTRLWKNPGVATIERTPEQAQSDAERGYSWRDYVLFFGTSAQFAHKTFRRLGVLSWVYLASDGSRWQITLFVDDINADPWVVKAEFVRFGEIRKGTADDPSVPVTLTTIANPASDPVYWLNIAGVSGIGNKVLLDAHSNPLNLYGNDLGGVDVLNTFNVEQFNYGPCIGVYEITVAETANGNSFSLSLSLTTLKTKAQCQSGVVVVDPENHQTLPWTLPGATVDILISRAYESTWVMRSYYDALGAAKFVTLRYEDEVSGTCITSYGFDENITIPPCFTGITTDFNVQDQRTYRQAIVFDIGGVEFRWQSTRVVDFSDVGVPAANNQVTHDLVHVRDWQSVTPFGDFDPINQSNSLSVTKLFCIDPTPLPNVSSASAIPTYAGVTSLVQYVDGAPNFKTTYCLPMLFVNGERQFGIVEIIRASSGQWSYQFRYLHLVGVGQNLPDAAAVVDTGKAIVDRVPLYGSNNPVTGEFMYGKASRICYV